MRLSLPAFLHTGALVIALCVQDTATPLAGAWVFLHLAACAVLLKDGYERKSIVWHACLAWLIALGLSAFFIMPIGGACVFMWTLAAMPMLALCMKDEHLQSYINCFGTVLAVYAAGLILQMMLQVHYTNFDYEGRMAWPLIDPNNAAAVLNMGLIPAFWLALKKPKWFALFAAFALAMYATGSKAGVICGMLGCSILLAQRYGAITFAYLGIAAGFILPFCHGLVDSFASRFPIWEASVKMLWVMPWTGLGLGSFGYYYAQVRTENYTAGYYAHNDLLQLAIEMGFPCVIIFTGLIAAVMITTRARNIAPACAMLAVFLQSMVEFQFYIPSISLLLGLAVACHERKIFVKPKIVLKPRPENREKKIVAPAEHKSRKAHA